MTTRLATPTWRSPARAWARAGRGPPRRLSTSNASSRLLLVKAARSHEPALRPSDERHLARSNTRSVTAHAFAICSSLRLLLDRAVASRRCQLVGQVEAAFAQPLVKAYGMKRSNATARSGRSCERGDQVALRHHDRRRRRCARGRDVTKSVKRAAANPARRRARSSSSGAAECTE